MSFCLNCNPQKVLDLWNFVGELIDEGETLYPGKTYEEGIADAFEFINHKSTDVFSDLFQKMKNHDI